MSHNQRIGWALALILALYGIFAIGQVSLNSGVSIVNPVNRPAPITCTTAPTGSSLLLLGACLTADATCPGVTTNMVPHISPNTFPGAGMVWNVWVSGVNTVTVKECALLSITPPSTTYNVWIQP